MHPDNPPTRQPRRLRHRFFHQDRPSWLADSFRGIKAALRRGFRWSDTNYLTTRDGHLVNCHWQRPLMHGWHDPEGALKRSTPVYKMSLEDVRRLRSRTGDYRIHTAEDMVSRAGREGLRLELELKRCLPVGQPTPARMQSVRRAADRARADVIVKTLTRPGSTSEAVGRLRTCHRAGFVTCILPRGSRRVPRSAWRWIDYVRGPVRWYGPTVEPKESDHRG